MDPKENVTPHDLANDFITELINPSTELSGHLLEEYILAQSLSKSEVQYILRSLDRVLTENQTKGEELILKGNNAKELRTLLGDWNMINKSVATTTTSLTKTELSLTRVDNELRDLEQQCKSESQQLQMGRRELESAYKLEKIYKQLKEYDILIGLGQYFKASQLLQEVRSEMEQNGAQQKTDAHEMLNIRFNDIMKGITFSLGFAIEQSFQIIEREQYSKEIHLYSKINFGPGVPSLDVCEALCASHTLNIIADCLKRFSLDLFSKIFTPIFQIKDLCCSINLASQDVIEINFKEGSEGLKNKNPLDMIHRVLESIYLWLSEKCTFSDVANINQKFISIVGSHIYQRIIFAFRDSWVVPNNFDDLADYSRDMLLQGVSFEQYWGSRGFIPNESKFLLKGECEKIPQGLINTRIMEILEKTLIFCRTQKTDVDLIDEYIYDGVSMRKANEKDSFFAFPKCYISSKVKDLVNYLDECLSEELLLNLSAFTIVQLVRKIVDIFVLTLPPNGVDGKSMIIVNDLEFLARKIHLYFLQFPNKGIRICDGTYRLKRKAAKYYSQILNLQKGKIDDIFLNGVQARTSHQLSSTKSAFEKADVFIEGLFSEWQQILSNKMLKIAAGELLSHLFTTLISKILSLDDISDDESLRLQQFLLNFSKYEKIYTTIQEVEKYVKSHRKFSKLGAILQMNMSDIITWHRTHQLLEFSTDELVHLIKSLFAASALREKNLKEITKSFDS